MEQWNDTTVLLLGMKFLKCFTIFIEVGAKRDEKGMETG